MSAPEWSRYVRDELGVPLEPPEISDRVVANVLEGYEQRLPLLPGAEAAVDRIAARWPLGLASSSNKPVIDRVMETSGWGEVFRVWVSSEEVDRGSPRRTSFSRPYAGSPPTRVKQPASRTPTTGSSPRAPPAWRA